MTSTEVNNIIKIPPLFGTAEDGYMSISQSSMKSSAYSSSVSYSDDSSVSVPSISSPNESLSQCSRKIWKIVIEMYYKHSVFIITIWEKGEKKMKCNANKPTNGSSSKRILFIVIPKVIPIICDKITRKMDASWTNNRECH